MPDNLLRIGAEFDVSQIIAGAQNAVKSFSDVEKSAIEMAQGLRASGLSLDQVQQQMIEAGVNSQTTAVAIEELASTESAATSSTEGLSAEQAKLVVTTEAASAATGNFTTSQSRSVSAMGAARVEMGAIEGSAGMMAGGLARVAAQSEILAPLIQAAFIPFAIYAFVEILGQVGDALEKVIGDMVGYTKEVQEAEKATIKWSQANEEHSHSLVEAQGKLHATLQETGTIAQESFGEKWVKASQEAMHATDALGVATAVLKDPFKLFTPIGTLFTANEGAANRAVQLGKNYEGASKDIEKFTVAQDQAALSIDAAREAADRAGASGSRIEQIKIEIAALNQEQRIKEEIARKENKPDEIPAIGEEYYYKRIQLSNELSTAETEQVTKARNEHDQLTQSADRVVNSYNKLFEAEIDIQDKETEMFAKSEEKDVTKSLEATVKMIEARVKYQEEVAKLSEQVSIKNIEEQQKEVSASAQLETLKRETSITTAYGRAIIADQINAEILAKDRQLEDQRLAVEMDYLNKLKAIELGGLSEQQFVVTANPEQLAKLAQINAQIEAAQQQHVAKMQEFDRQAQLSTEKVAKAQEDAYLKAFQPVNRAFDGMVNGILQGTLTVQRAFYQMGANIVLTTIDAIAQLGLKWAEHFLVVDVLERISVLNRIATFLSGETIKKSIQVAAAASEVTESAGVGAAAAFASVLLALPFPLNVATAPEVAATQFAAIEAIGLPKAERGALLPADMAISAHAGELILPKPISSGLQSVIPAMQKFGDVTNNSSSTSSSAKTAMQGGDTNLHINFSTFDQKGVADFIHGNRAEFTKAFKTAVRNGVRPR